MEREAILNKMTARNVGFDLAHEAAGVSMALQKASHLRKEIIETAARQIRTHEAETLEDNVVSFYPCFIHDFDGETKLFSSDVPEKRFLIESTIDPLERNGMVRNGFIKLQQELERVSGPKFFLWISLRGSAGTEGIYKDINYRYHQIYIGEVNGRNTRAYALKSDIDENILAAWVNSFPRGAISTQGEAIQEFLLNPIVLPCYSKTHILETALFKLKQLLEKSGQTSFYKDVRIDEVPNLIREKTMQQEMDTRRIAQELDRSLSSDSYLGYEEARRVIGGQLYVLYERYANEKGDVQLSGCAGGSINIRSLFGRGPEIPTIKIPSVDNIFATAFRLKGLFDEDEGFVCVCGWKAHGPLGDRPCGGCGLTKEKAKKEGMAVC